MKKASLHSIFWILLVIALSFLVAYIFTGTNVKNMALLNKDLQEKGERGINTFEIKDVIYSEVGSVATLEFNLVNLGTPIELNGWILEFSTLDGKTICRTTLFTGNPLENSRIYTEVTVPSRDVILEYGDTLYPSDVATVSITLLSTCLNETINYARTMDKMVIKLTIPPMSSSVITRCLVDTTTGFAECTE